MHDTTPADPARPGPRPSPERRAAMLSAAIELFAERGVAATSTREIARRAGVTERTLFKHFGSKEGLAQAAVGQIVASFGSEAFARALDPTPFTAPEFASWMRGFLQNRLAGLAAAPANYAVLFRELIGDPTFRAQYGAAWIPGVFRPLEGHLAAMQDRGAISRARSPRELASAFFALNLSYLLTRSVLAPDAGWSDDADVAAITGMFMAICGAPADP